MLWHHSSQASDLIADCALNPPKPELRTNSFNHAYGYYDERDPRVAELLRIHRKFGRTVDPDSPAGRHWMAVDVDAAISAAVAELKMGEAA